MFYLIYKITNNLNNKIYIGFHKTKNKDDGYMGSGKYLNHAYKKHGLENFTKEILFEYDNPKEMYDKEAELVNEDFLTNENTYNLKIGGFGGWDHINTSSVWGGYGNLKNPEIQAKTAASRKLHYKTDPEFANKVAARGRIAIAKVHALKLTPFAGKIHSTETKIKMSISHKGLGIAENNSQYGTCWITNIILKKSIKIDKDLLQSYIDNGWTKGRKLKFPDN